MPKERARKKLRKSGHFEGSAPENNNDDIIRKKKNRKRRRRRTTVKQRSNETNFEKSQAISCEIKSAQSFGKPTEFIEKTKKHKKAAFQFGSNESAGEAVSVEWRRHGFQETGSKLQVSNNNIDIVLILNHLKTSANNLKQAFENALTLPNSRLNIPFNPEVMMLQNQSFENAFSGQVHLHKGSTGQNRAVNEIFEEGISNARLIDFVNDETSRDWNRNKYAWNENPPSIKPDTKLSGITKGINSRHFSSITCIGKALRNDMSSSKSQNNEKRNPSCDRKRSRSTHTQSKRYVFTYGSRGKKLSIPSNDPISLKGELLRVSNIGHAGLNFCLKSPEYEGSFGTLSQEGELEANSKYPELLKTRFLKSYFDAVLREELKIFSLIHRSGCKLKRQTREKHAIYHYWIPTYIFQEGLPLIEDSSAIEVVMNTYRIDSTKLELLRNLLHFDEDEFAAINYKVDVRNSLSNIQLLCIVICTQGTVIYKTDEILMILGHAMDTLLRNVDMSCYEENRQEFLRSLRKRSLKRAPMEGLILCTSPDHILNIDNGASEGMIEKLSYEQHVLVPSILAYEARFKPFLKFAKSALSMRNQRAFSSSSDSTDELGHEQNLCELCCKEQGANRKTRLILCMTCTCVASQFAKQKKSRKKSLRKIMNRYYSRYCNGKRKICASHIEIKKCPPKTIKNTQGVFYSMRDKTNQVYKTSLLQAHAERHHSSLVHVEQGSNRIETQTAEKQSMMMEPQFQRNTDDTGIKKLSKDYLGNLSKHEPRENAIPCEMHLPQQDKSQLKAFSRTRSKSLSEEDRLATFVRKESCHKQSSNQTFSQKHISHTESTNALKTSGSLRRCHRKEESSMTYKGVKETVQKSAGSFPEETQLDDVHILSGKPSDIEKDLHRKKGQVCSYVLSSLEQRTERQQEFTNMFVEDEISLKGDRVLKIPNSASNFSTLQDKRSGIESEPEDNDGYKEKLINKQTQCGNHDLNFQASMTKEHSSIELLSKCKPKENTKVSTAHFDKTTKKPGYKSNMSGTRVSSKEEDRNRDDDKQNDTDKLLKPKEIEHRPIISSTSVKEGNTFIHAEKKKEETRQSSKLELETRKLQLLLKIKRRKEKIDGGINEKTRVQVDRPETLDSVMSVKDEVTQKEKDGSLNEEPQSATHQSKGKALKTRRSLSLSNKNYTKTDLTVFKQVLKLQFDLSEEIKKKSTRRLGPGANSINSVESTITELKDRIASKEKKRKSDTMELTFARIKDAKKAELNVKRLEAAILDQTMTIEKLKEQIRAHEAAQHHVGT